jgi:hypothetical protein
MMVVCINNSRYEKSLEIGKVYEVEVIRQWNDMYYINYHLYSQDRFKPYNREENLNELLS